MKIGKKLIALSLLGMTVGFAAFAKPKNETLTVIYPTTEVAVPVVAVAKAKGYFEEEGLNPNFVTMAQGTTEAVSTGKADVVLQGIIPGLSFAAQGAGVQVFAGTASGGNFIITKPENAARFANIANWNGQKVGVIRLSTSEVVTRHALDQKGVKVTYVEIDSHPNVIEAVRKGNIDIGSIPSEFAQAARDLGLTLIFPMTTLEPNYVCCREVGNSKSLVNKRSAYVKFVAAQIRAYKDFQQDPAGVTTLLAKVSSQSEEYVRNVIFNTDTNADRVFNPPPNLHGVSSVYDTLRNGGYIEKNGPSIDKVVDTSIYKEALDSIIKRYPNEKVYQDLARQYTAWNL